MHREFSEIIKGRVADVRNADNGTSFMAGTSKAAAFLENFIDKSKWAHIDIAGVTYVDRPKPYDYPMATGYGVRMLIKFLEKI
jgi:leucyl aminopeptidase